MSNNPSDVQTSVQQVDLDIDSWLGSPTADSIITPPSGDTPPPNNMFSSKNVNLDFLNDPKIVDGKKEKDDDDDVSRETVDDIIDEIDGVETVDNKTQSSGRPKTDKSGLVGFLKKRIESKEMFAFDDYDEGKQTLEDYLSSLSEKDVDELWQANIDNLKNEVAAKTPQEFFESLPEKLQYAAKYVMDGGEDLSTLFQVLAQSEQVQALDPTDENDQEGIIRSYLRATSFGSEEEIDEELNTWKDLGVLEKKAKQFKPKLDQMQEQIIQAQLAEQEERKEQQEAAAQAYMQNVFEALRPGEINGLKLDKKIQAQLYTGLTQPQYPSISGRPTNLFGHLLEKYQFVEPNYPLIAEALWLLSDPDSYRDQLRRQGGNQKVEQTVRQLKTEQSRRTQSTYEDDEPQTPKTRKISRPVNIFKR
jgi:hypothetical protein